MYFTLNLPGAWSPLPHSATVFPHHCWRENHSIWALGSSSLHPNPHSDWQEGGAYFHAKFLLELLLVSCFLTQKWKLLLPLSPTVLEIHVTAFEMCSLLILCVFYFSSILLRREEMSWCSLAEWLRSCLWLKLPKCTLRNLSAGSFCLCTVLSQSQNKTRCTTLLHLILY